MADHRRPFHEPLTISELVRMEIYRGKSEGGFSPPEEVCVNDLIPTVGRTYIARRIAGGDSQTAPGSAMAYMAVGTGSAAPTLTDSFLAGEVKRKALAVSTAGQTAVNVYTAVATFGGAADSITSLQLQEAAIYNHASSGNGTMMQRVTFAAVTLADSDLVRLTLETNVGSS